MTDRAKYGITVTVNVTLLLAFAGFVFHMGIWKGTVEERLNNMTKVGGVPISTEARERFGKIEPRLEALEKFKERVERQMNGVHK